MDEDNQAKQRKAEGRYFIDEAANAIAAQRGRDEFWALNFSKAMVEAAATGALTARDSATWLPLERGRPIGISAMVTRDDVNAWLESTKPGYKWDDNPSKNPAQRRQRIQEFVNSGYSNGRTKSSLFGDLAKVEQCTVDNIKRIYYGKRKPL